MQSTIFPLRSPLWKSPNHELIQLIFRDACNYKPLIRFYVIIRYFPRTPWRRTRGRIGGMTRGTRESRREKVKWTVTGSRWKTGDRDGENGDSGGSVGKIGKERKRGKMVESGARGGQQRYREYPVLADRFPANNWKCKRNEPPCDSSIIESLISVWTPSLALSRHFFRPSSLIRFFPSCSTSVYESSCSYFPPDLPFFVLTIAFVRRIGKKWDSVCSCPRVGAAATTMIVRILRVTRDRESKRVVVEPLAARWPISGRGLRASAYISAIGCLWPVWMDGWIMVCENWW